MPEWRFFLNSTFKIQHSTLSISRRASHRQFNCGGQVVEPGFDGVDFPVEPGFRAIRGNDHQPRIRVKILERLEIDCLRRVELPFAFDRHGAASSSCKHEVEFVFLLVPPVITLFRPAAHPSARPQDAASKRPQWLSAKKFGLPYANALNTRIHQVQTGIHPAGDGKMVGTSRRARPTIPPDGGL